MKISFYIQSDAAPKQKGKIKERVPVYIRFNDGRKFDLRAKTGQVINPKLWDADKWKPGFPKTNLRDAEQRRESNIIASELKKIDRELTELYNTRHPGQAINMDWLKRYLQPEKATGAAPIELVPYFEYYQQARGADLCKASIVKLNVIKHLLERYQKEQRKEILIQDVNGEFKTEFFAYSQRQGYAPNTTARKAPYSIELKSTCVPPSTSGAQR